MSHTIVLITNLFFYIVGAYLLFNCLYLLIFAVAGLFLRKTVRRPVSTYARFCVLFPAYKENSVILESSLRALQHQYSGQSDIVVIADGLNQETIITMKDAGVKVIEVNFVKSTKGKSLLYAMDNIDRSAYDIAVILDIDNIMSERFLEDVNEAFVGGARVVQAHRTAKNLDTSFAFLDACNEEINNNIYRKGHYALGLSPALIGSGMAFEFNFLHQLLTDIGDTVGEDKEMDFKIAKQKIGISYLNDTLVFDEKIENAAVFTQQRTRWIAAQIEFFKKYFFEGFYELFVNRNFEFFNKVLQSMLVPRMLLLGLLFVLSVVCFFPFSGLQSYFFLLLFLTLCFSLVISLPIKYWQNKQLSSALFRIPYALWCMVLAVLRINQAKASFLPTPHQSTPGKTDSQIK